MRCGRVRRLLSVYADEQTTERERLRVGLHLTQCRDCRKRLEELRSFRLTLQASPRVAVPADFSAAWRARLRQEAASTQKKEPVLGWSRRVLILAPAAASILLVVTGLAVLLPRLSSRGAVLVPEGKMLQEARPRTLLAERPKQAESTPTTGQRSSSVGGAPITHTEQAPGTMPMDNSAGGGLLDQGGGYETKGGGRIAPVVPGPMAAAADQSTARTGSGPAAPSVTKAGPDRPASLTGLWRVWLTAAGPRPLAVKRVLVEQGLLRQADSPAALDAPFILCQGLAYSEAQELAQRLQEAGARTIVELMPH